MVIQGNAQLVFYNVENYPLLGKISSDTETPYERLPKYLKDITRPPVWDLGKNTAGLAVRFRSNSTQIAAKWALYQDNVANHMAFTGIKGLDLYALENNKWEFVNSARPSGKSNQTVIISDMEVKMREFMLFLPLYDGVTALEIGIEHLAFEFPVTLYKGHFTELGYNAIAYSGVRNGWVRNVEIRHADSGIFISGANCTVTGVVWTSTRKRDGGRNSTGHHGITLGGTDHLLSNFDFRTKFIHDITTSRCLADRRETLSSMAVAKT